MNEVDAAEVEWFAPMDDYIASQRCPRCKAEPWQPCDMRIRSRSGKFHAPRQDAGIRHRSRDIRNAPWMEEREPGRRYHSIDYAGRP